MTSSARISRVIAFAFLLAFAFTFTQHSPDVVSAGDNKTATRRQAVRKSLDLLEKSARQWPAACASCHHQVLQIVTAEAARARGYRIDASFLRTNKPKTEKHKAE